MPGKKVCIVGSGNWGSAIAKIVGGNVQSSEEFAEEVQMWVFEEMVEGRKLTEIINEDHENKKYLPGHTIPSNVIANPELTSAAHNADILIFVLPHQFIRRICDTLHGKIKNSAIVVSLIKGLEEREDGTIRLISEIITEGTGRPCQVLMGANLANNVAEGQFCESTIGSECGEAGDVLKRLFQTPNFRISVARDARTVELCGALKNVVAVGAGLTDGLNLGDNTKAAIIRIGLMEMVEFVSRFYPPAHLTTFLESCGLADLVTTCYGGRNRRVAEAFARSGKTIEELEKELLNGQSAQGPHTARHVYALLRKHDLAEKFPLFTAIHRICIKEIPPEGMIQALRDHPQH